MSMNFEIFKVSMVVSALLLAVPEARAVSVTSFGTPVTASGSSVNAVPNCANPSSPGCFNPATGTTNFYIPIKSADNGMFGVTMTPSGLEAGTFSDIKTGPFSNPNSLTMYLRFAPLAPLPLSSATLTLSFVDLDLVGGNDPSKFFETVQVFAGNGSAMSPLITTLGQSGTWPLTYTVSGNSTSQNILFSDVRSLLDGNPFDVKLKFGASTSAYGTWQNTMESMTATLATTSPVPEPSALFLFGSGFAGLAVWRGMTRRSGME
jgi:hypothetical protein